MATLTKRLAKNEVLPAGTIVCGCVGKGDFCEKATWEHQSVLGVIKSLRASPGRVAANLSTHFGEVCDVRLGWEAAPGDAHHMVYLGPDGNAVLEAPTEPGTAVIELGLLTEVLSSSRGRVVWVPRLIAVNV